MAMQSLMEILRSPTTVVVPLDGSEFAARALPHAVDAADAFGARLVLVGSRVGGGDVEETRGYLRSVAVDYGHREAECIVVTDRTAAPAVASVAGEDRGAMVVMASHGRGAVRHLVLGSVAEQLLAQHAGPVLVVGPMAERGRMARAPQGPVLLGIDEHETDDARIAMAAVWAATRHSRIEMVSVVNPVRVHNPAPAEHARVAERIAAMAGEGTLTVTSHFIENHDRANELAVRADAVGASLIVIGTHSPTGVERLVAGNVAMRVVHLAGCPVLIVSPVRTHADV
jgi:nucleotide-binding universal stress UspA family protein